MKVGPEHLSASNLLGEYVALPAYQVAVRDLEGLTGYTSLLHECIHMISDLYELDLSEATVRALDQQITVLIRENHWLVEGLQQDQ